MVTVFYNNDLVPQEKEVIYLSRLGMAMSETVMPMVVVLPRPEFGSPVSAGQYLSWL